MSGVKADWRLADLLDEDDPFADVILTSGLRVNLAGSGEELSEAISATLKREGALWEQGIVCPLKEAGQDCLTCPKATMNPNDPMSALCRLGHDQYTILKRADLRQRERVAPFTELADCLTPMMEIGDISSEYSELLTAAGL